MHVEAGGPAAQAVEGADRQAVGPRLAAQRRLPDIDHVEPVLGAPDQLRDQLGRVLEMRRHGDDEVADRGVEAGGERDLGTVMAGEDEEAQVGVAGGKGPDDLDRAVARGIVGQDQLVVGEARLQHALDTVDEGRNACRLVVDRHDDRDDQVLLRWQGGRPDAERACCRVLQAM